MSYSPITDFPALFRITGGGVRSIRVPGLDFVVDALYRAGLINLFIGQTAPVANQITTAWFQPAIPSWDAEGVLWLWDASLNAYQVATPALWAAYFQLVLSGYKFQSAVAPVNNITVGTTILAVQRDNPAATSLVLPNLGPQWASSAIKNGELDVVDFSTNVVNHVITVSTPDGATIVGKASWQLLSTPDQLAGIKFTPVPELNSWIIAP